VSDVRASDPRIEGGFRSRNDISRLDITSALSRPVSVYAVPPVDRVIGSEFTVASQAIEVTHLGAFDFGTDGLGSAHEVGIWKLSDKSLITSGTVASGTSGALDGFFRYVDIMGVTLAANTTSVIAALWSGNSDQFVWDAETPPYSTVDVGGYTVDSRLSIGAAGSARRTLSSTLVSPVHTDASNFRTRAALWGPNHGRPTSSRSPGWPRPSQPGRAVRDRPSTTAAGWMKRQ
jgi:hypothetical protein